MRIPLLFLLLSILIFQESKAQSIFVMPPDASDYPLIKSEIYVADENLNFLHDLKKSDIRLTENGEEKQVSTNYYFHFRKSCADFINNY